MTIFQMMGSHGCEYVTACCDEATKLRAFIAISNTSMGPALAGLRMWNYGSEEEALLDALRLARDMALRTAVSGCDLSGGSIVIWGNHKVHKSEALLRALGRFIESLEGRLIATTELGTSCEDLECVCRETEYAVNLPLIGSMSGEEGLATAWGVYYGIMACVKEIFKLTTLKDLKVGVQGAGRVGRNLIELIKKREPGVQLSISDIDYDRMKIIQDCHPDIKIVSPEEILQKEYDIFIPCALGGIITPEVASALRCRMIAGAATCVLSDASAADVLHGKGILFAPDFVINAGGVLQAEDEITGRGAMQGEESYRKIARNLVGIVSQAREEDSSPYRVALRLARERIENISRVSHILAVR
ncbi:MAG: Glu/Leu/Phe/Val dehydrogenase dimerization domain-containing protein [Candidatus Eremiobacteraeota bacterium]|nr:Glu/Leu/Phe/Val dehydrogenase dimerization domain-containing protein [Candidatus Eremiobacteraeota bacterium]